LRTGGGKERTVTKWGLRCGCLREEEFPEKGLQTVHLAPSMVGKRVSPSFLKGKEGGAGWKVGEKKSTQELGTRGADWPGRGRSGAGSEEKSRSSAPPIPSASLSIEKKREMALGKRGSHEEGNRTEIKAKNQKFSLGKGNVPSKLPATNFITGNSKKGLSRRAAQGHFTKKRNIR